ncbi:hypothetical protein QN354_12205 [Cryobacterium sp. 5I3]|nr:hypothetical protein [Cryobacterium sp. 5I3]MEB0202513.1 hypothetical protein [Cryobacterium sp. 5I3]
MATWFDVGLEESSETDVAGDLNYGSAFHRGGEQKLSGRSTAPYARLEATKD